MLDLLLVVRGAERAGDERLRLAAREDDRAVNAREHAGLAPDRADLVELAAVETDAACSSTSSRSTFSLQLVEDVLRAAAFAGSSSGSASSRSSSTSSTVAVAFQLVVDPHRVAERAERSSPGPSLWNACVDLLGRRRRSFFLPTAAFSSSIAGDDLLDRGVRRFERADHLRLADFLRAGLDHHDAVIAAGDDEIERALLALVVGRVDDVRRRRPCRRERRQWSSRTGSPTARARRRRR